MILTSTLRAVAPLPTQPAIQLFVINLRPSGKSCVTNIEKTLVIPVCLADLQIMLNLKIWAQNNCCYQGIIYILKNYSNLVLVEEEIMKERKKSKDVFFVVLIFKNHLIIYFLMNSWLDNQ